VKQNLGVAVRAKAMSGSLERVTELSIVVDLSVLDDVQRAVLVRDRLIARLEVDDREPSRRECDPVVAELAEAVGAAMHERSAHGDDTVGNCRAVCRHDAADPAHGRSV
jgi:hypothetical protein